MPRFQLWLDQTVIGLTAIHDARTIGHFSLHKGYQQYGQLAFEQAKKVAKEQAAFVPNQRSSVCISIKPIDNKVLVRASFKL
ncbi:hypothetical protein Haur_2291 [Herpetosiphon aurantiacus DSM 785]|uniref:Uncharacterized protein n=1 Tax=Herpetosiphon aurantiacus (strain ATCC 23779 / DSM 785 / 114-95) TaxID=316274 RepID=A9AXW5_HERA2|nr:hypothetical protein Haur_2291 [Herpetosiphon aurantiacus DSM 785]